MQSLRTVTVGRRLALIVSRHDLKWSKPTRVFCSSFLFFLSFRFSTLVHPLDSFVRFPSENPSREDEEGCPNVPKELGAVGGKAGVADEVEISESTGAC